TSTATVSVTVKAAPLPPVADAGNAQTITLPLNNITLDGSKSAASTGNVIVGFSWSKVEGPAGAAISNINGASTTVSGLTEGTYKFQLVVQDDKGGTAAATVTITVNAAPPPPVADAGNSQTITLPLNSASLDGSGSIAPGGSISNYVWSKVSGPSGGIISDTSQKKTVVTGLLEGKYQYRLTVTDNRGVSASAILFITVKPAPLPPVANAGNTQVITLPESSIVLDGSQSSASSGTITSYKWRRISGPSAGVIANDASVKTAVDGLLAGTYVYELTVKDSNGNSATANVTIVVKPAPVVPPVADAGSDISIQLPQAVITLDGSKSYSSKGEIASYNWEKVSGPGSLSIINSGTAYPAIQNIEPGVYTFRLTVKDSGGNTNSDDVTITIVDEEMILPPPVANAGENRVVSIDEQEIFLDAGLSFAQFGTLVKFNWVLLSGPAGASIDYADSDLALVSGLTEGEYVFELTVTDNNGKTDKAIVKITVANTGGRKDLSPEIRVFPNPVHHVASVELKGPAKGRTSINVYDVNGKKVFATEFIKDDIYVNHQLNTSMLVSGVYFVEVVIDYQFRTVTKIIKQ
ncbi:MAG TPA: PKD domain-containing protein, partial [Agriterribacter sp.]|nr:PKD domain-containing protein [Agriterribacter sp.]